MPEGDVVTCCADGVARVWTSDPNKADPAAAALMEGDMAAAQLEKEKASLAEDQAKIKTEDPEVLQMPGASDGATKVIKEEGGAGDLLQKSTIFSGSTGVCCVYL